MNPSNDPAYQQEIAELRRMQQELRESEARYRSIVESAMDAIITIDDQSRITEFNPAAEVIFGWTREQVIGRDLGETIIPLSMREGHWRGMDRHRHSEHAPLLGVRLELKALRSDGSEFPIELTVSRLAGGPSFTAFIRDLTDRRTLEAQTERLTAQLSASESQYRSFFNGNPQPMCVYDTETLRFLAVNSAAVEQFGYSEAELMQLTVEVLRPEKDREIWKKELLAPSQEQRRFPGRYRCKNGELLYVETFANNICYQGRGARIVLAVDVTEQRRAAVALRESQRALAALIGNLPGMAYRCSDDRRWTMEFVSEGAHKLTGYRAQVLLAGGGTSYADLIHVQDRERVWAEVQAAIEGDYPYQLIYRITTAKGAEKWVWERGSAVRAADGKVLALEGFVSDITERRTAQEEISRLNAELEERVRSRTSQLEAANAELEAFSYSIAHDLRSPLTSIDGFSLSLEESCGKALDAHGQHYLHRIRAGVRQMSDLTDAMLSLANLSRVNLKLETVDLAAQARRVVAQLREGEPQRKVTLDIPDHLPAQGDPRLLAQVVTNLVGNAWKFSSRKPCTHIQLGSSRTDSGETIYFVSDKGAGFDMSYASRLFGAFQRLHGPSEFEGTGIGLALVQKILSRHAGRIWADAAVGDGATFYFTLASEPAS